MGKYSGTLMDHFMSPRNAGALESPDVTEYVGAPGHGPFLILYLRIEETRVVVAMFQTYGCGPTIACGSMLTELIIGRSLEVYSRLTTETLIASFAGVAAEKLHNPALVIAALRNAPKCYGRPCSPDAGFSILIVQ
jgi:NifU-like protein involved in Fe-S cluster formation